MPFTSIVAWVGKTSTSLPRRKLIMLNLSRGIERVARLFLEMHQRERQRIGSVWFRWRCQAEQPLHHLRHGEFLGCAVTHDGLLHLARRNLVDFQTGFGCGDEAGAPCFTHEDSRLKVLREEQTLDNADR